MNFPGKIGLFPLHSFINPGGVKRHVLALQKEFRLLGYSAQVVAPRRARNEDYGPGIEFLGHSWPLACNGSQGDFTFCSRRAAKNFLSEHNFDLIHFHNFGWHSWQVLRASRALNILTLHTDGANFPSWLWRGFAGLLKTKIHGLIAPSDFILKNFGDFPGPKTVIPNGVDLSVFNASGQVIERYAANKGPWLNILFLGRLEPRKGLMYLLRAYQFLKLEYPLSRLIVVGDGPERKMAQKFVARQKLADVFFEGQIGEKLAPAFFRSADIFVSPAIFGESFGMVLLEAMACAKPVVAFANPGYKQILTGPGAEFLAEPKDWQGLARKIEILIQNETRRREMGQWGIGQAKKYSWPRISEQTLAFYQKAYQWRENRLKNKQ